MEQNKWLEYFNHYFAKLPFHLPMIRKIIALPSVKRVRLREDAGQ